MSTIKCPLHKGFVMRLWPSFYPFLRKFSVVERCPLYRMSAIGRFHCSCLLKWSINRLSLRLFSVIFIFLCKTISSFIVPFTHLHSWISSSIQPRILESLAGCLTMLLFAVFSKIGALKRNTYWFHVKLVFIVIFGQSFKLDVRA